MSDISYELRQDIACIKLSRPQKRNAMSDNMLAELGEAVDRAAKEAKAAILFGDHQRILQII